MTVNLNKIVSFLLNTRYFILKKREYSIPHQTCLFFLKLTVFSLHIYANLFVLKAFIAPTYDKSFSLNF